MRHKIIALVTLLLVSVGITWLVLSIGATANATPGSPAYYPVITGTLYGCVKLSNEGVTYWELHHPGEPCANGYAQFQVVQPTATPSTSPSPSPSASTSG